MRFITFLDRHTPSWALCSMCFIAMEHCAGGSLVHWIDRMKSSGRRTTLEEAAIIGAQLVSALSFCHSQEPPIGHFDLKPDNVFIMGDFLEVRKTNLIYKNLILAQTGRFWLIANDSNSDRIAENRLNSVDNAWCCRTDTALRRARWEFERWVLVDFFWRVLQRKEGRKIATIGWLGIWSHSPGNKIW